MKPYRVRVSTALIAVFVVLAPLPPRAARAADAPANVPTTTTTTTTARTSADVTLQVHAVRITRGFGDHQEHHKRWAGRFHNETSPGVVLQLLLTLKDGAALPVSREALAIGTFVDDMYQNLLGGPNETRYAYQVPPVSVDGRHVLLTVASSRPPADAAERVFVRGSLNARITRGKPQTSAAKLALKVGAQAQVGRFKTAMRSVADNDRNLTITLAVTGDATRIRQVRVLSKDGTRIDNDEVRQHNRFTDHGVRGAGGERVSTLHVNIPPAQDEVTIEYDYAQKVEDVRIPFEAQVDIGQTRVVPIEAAAREPAGHEGPRGDARAKERPQEPGARRAKPWPPPPVGAATPGAGFPPRRAAFDPATRPVPGTPAADDNAGNPKLEKAAVDLFSLTVSKPAPGEAEGAAWQNPPPRFFAPGGFTIARLMLLTPDATIMSVPPDGVTITRFEDEKGRHDTTVYAEPTPRGGFRNDRSLVLTPDGRQALLAVTMASAPTPGATRCTLAGEIKAQVARGDKSEASEPVPFAKGHRVRVGPATIRFGDIRQHPPLTPAPHGDVERGLARRDRVGQGPVDRAARRRHRATARPPARRHVERERHVQGQQHELRPALRPTPARARHRARAPHREDRGGDVPFEVTTGIGL